MSTGADEARRSVRVIDGGLLSTVQDLGRQGYGFAGVSPSGAADWYAARAANLLVGNGENAAVLESTLTGMTMDVLADAVLAVTGAEAPITIGAAPRSAWTSHSVRAGQRVVVGPAVRGARSYVAFGGGIVVPRVLGGSATDVNGAFGGFAGRGLTAGDVLDVGEAPAAVPRSPLAYPAAALPDFETLPALRVMRGPHDGMRGIGAEALCGREYRVSSRSSRQALRLEGEPLELEAGSDVISAGTCAGCVQVAGDGRPMLLLVEHQTTGGYAVPCCVIAADVPRAAQLRPGDAVTFALVPYAAATLALRALGAHLRSLGPAARGGEPDLSARLGRGFFEGV